MSKQVITVVGAGALGSHVVQFMRNIGLIRVIDFDRIEHKNVQAQFHGMPNVGKNKALAMGQVMQLLFNQQLATIPHKLTPVNANTLLTASTLVIDCTDNAEARSVIKGIAVLTKLPVLHGALAADGHFGRVVWDENFAIDSEVGMGGATCEDGEHLPFIALVSSLIARSAQEFLKSGRKRGYEINPTGVIPT